MIKNISKTTIPAEKSKLARNLQDKLFGLLLKENKNIAMIFRSRFGIHTFFMKYPIDVLILDNNKKVVRLRKNLKPGRIFLWNPKFDLVIELPVGSINNSSTEIGDMIEVRS